MLVLLTFDDIVFHNLNQSFAGLDTGIPNNDAQSLLYPFFDHFLDSLRETGRLDPWNPFVWGGTPAIGNPNVPFNILLFGLFHLSKPDFLVAMHWHLVAEFCLAATGLFLLCRRLRLSWAYSLLASLLYIYSSSAAWLTNTYCIFFHWAVIPWVLLALLTSAKRKTKRTVAFLGFVFYFQITYGQAQMTLYSAFFFLISVLWIFREFFERRRAMRLLAGGYFVGVCLSAHYLLPQVEFLRQAGDRLVVDWGATAARFQVPYEYLAHLFVPRLFWVPMPWWPEWTDGWSLWESFNVYIGLTFLGLSLYGVVRRENRPPFLRRLKLLCLALVGLNVTRLGGEWLIALNFGRAVPYSRITQFLLIPLLFTALWEMEAVFASRKELKKYLFFQGALLGGLVLFSRHFTGFVVGLFSKSSLTQASERAHAFLKNYHQLLSDALVYAGFLIVAGILLTALTVLFYDRPWFRRTCLSLLVVVGLVDVVDFFRSQRQTGREPYPFQASLEPRGALVNALKARAPELDRYYFSTYTGRMEMTTRLAPNLSAVAKVPSVNGYTSFVPRSNELQPPLYRGNWGFAFPELSVKLLSIRYVLLGPETPALPYAARLAPIARQGEYVLMEYARPLPRYYFPRNITGGASLEAQRLRLTDPEQASYSQDALDFETPEGCRPTYRLSLNGNESVLSLVNPCGKAVYFAFHEMKYVWWHLELDGQKITPVPINLVHQAVAVPPGKHELIFKCVPMSWYVGLALSAFTATLLGAYLLAGFPLATSFFGFGLRPRRPLYQ